MIKATSATSLKVLNQVRGAVPVVYGAVVYHERITSQSLAGYLISMASFACYAYLKSQPPPPLKRDSTQGEAGAAAEGRGEVELRERDTLLREREAELREREAR
mmetsp:Transcript_17983/g.49736  ORF Transcript_17983/g.49736 Transcript_17983/m.49736 type:complete len:104 (-) Transcript_17983:142-453(-)